MSQMVDQADQIGPKAAEEVRAVDPQVDLAQQPQGHLLSLRCFVKVNERGDEQPGALLWGECMEGMSSSHCLPRSLKRPLLGLKSPSKLASEASIVSVMSLSQGLLICTCEGNADLKSTNNEQLSVDTKRFRKSRSISMYGDKAFATLDMLLTHSHCSAVISFFLSRDRRCTARYFCGEKLNLDLNCSTKRAESEFNL